MSQVKCNTIESEVDFFKKRFESAQPIIVKGLAISLRMGVLEDFFIIKLIWMDSLYNASFILDLWLL